MDRINDAESLLFHMAPLVPIMEIPGVTEVCINGPGIVDYEEGPVWKSVEVPALDSTRCMDIAIAVASYTGQSISEMQPLLDGKLPGGQRIKIVAPPVVENMSITIRVHGGEERSIQQYDKDGAFSRLVWAENARLDERMGDLRPVDRILVGLLRERRYVDFLTKIIEFHMNVAYVGDTGSGKTTLMKAQCQLIDRMERVITIEDTRELFLPRHHNKVHLLYSKGGQGRAQVTPADLIQTTMRMKPDRVLLAELRGSEAFDLLKLLTTGHNGTLTSFHAESCALATERFSLMAREHDQARAYTDEALKRLVQLTMDVIIHLTARPVFNAAGERIAKERFVTEIYFDPVQKVDLAYGNARLNFAGK